MKKYVENMKKYVETIAKYRMAPSPLLITSHSRKCTLRDDVANFELHPYIWALMTSHSGKLP